MKFKVGDKVVPINKTIGWKLEKSKEWQKAQDIGQNYLYIIRIDEDGTHSCSVSAHSYGGDHFAESDLKLFYGEKSKNERITELEKRLISLEERLAKLEQANKLITQDVQRQTVTCAKTQNQLRKEIIERAKKVVDDFVTSRKVKDFNFRFSDVDRFTQLIIYNKDGSIKKVLTTRCHPNDVFNEWIGKAILVRKFYGQDVSEFENAVQPTEVVKGMIVKNKCDVIREIYAVKPTKRTYKTEEDFEFKNANKGYTFIDENDFEYWTRLDQIERIIDDTNAEY